MNSPGLFDDSNLPSAREMKFAVITAEWNDVITSKLHTGCVDTLKKHGASQENIVELKVPGSFELISAARMAVEYYPADAIICLGCVVKGQTRHDEYINNSVAQGLSQLTIKYGKPFIFGLLTTENDQQAFDRAGGQVGHKGVEAAITAIKMVQLRTDFFGRIKT